LIPSCKLFIWQSSPLAMDGSISELLVHKW
jgi:hypothetical protein